MRWLMTAEVSVRRLSYREVWGSGVRLNRGFPRDSTSGLTQAGHSYRMTHKPSFVLFILLGNYIQFIKSCAVQCGCHQEWGGAAI